MMGEGEGRRETICVFVQISATETAPFYFYEDFIVFWDWDGDFFDTDIELVVEASCSHHGAAEFWIIGKCECNFVWNKRLTIFFRSGLDVELRNIYISVDEV